MRKVTVLLLVMTALLCAPLFADGAEAAFSGEFTTSAATDFDQYGDSISDYFYLDLTATYGEYTTFTMGIEGSGTENSFYCEAYDAEMEQDFTGVFGDGLVLKYSLGYMSFEAEDDYWQFSGYDGMSDFSETSTAASVQVTFGVEALYASVWVSPNEMINDDEEFGAEVSFAVDALSGAVNYTKVAAAEDGMVGAAVNYTTDDFEVGAVVNDDLDGETLGFGVNAAAYMIDGVTPTVAYSCDDTEELAINSFVGVSVEYTVTDDVMVFAAVNADNFEDIALGANAGVEFGIDNVTFDVSANYGENAYNGYDAGLFGAEDFYVSLVVDADF